jgi:predicted DNA-binding transcriptional regulator AlpA
MTPASPFMRLSEVLALVRLSRWTVWRMASEGLFPQPVRVSPGRAYYLASDVDHWIATRRADPGSMAGRPRSQPGASHRTVSMAAPGARAPVPGVPEPLRHAGRSTRFPRRVAAAATRRRLFEPVAPLATPQDTSASLDRLRGPLRCT